MQELLIYLKALEEENMDEVLEYVFGFVRETSKSWLDMNKDPEKRLRFQNFIFEENIEFSGESFGTTKLSPIYSIYQQYLEDPSNLVTLRGIEPRLPG